MQNKKIIHKTSRWLLFGFLLLSGLSLSACQSTSSRELTKKVGADKDQHGCVASAGYSWCQKENSCVRPWELAVNRAISKDPASFNMYCQNNSHKKQID